MPRQKANSAFFLLIVTGLLFAFVLTGWTAWRDKSATFDEPLHFMGAWLQTHYADFRCDPEDPPLWKYYAAIGTAKDRLQVPTSGLIWDSILNNPENGGLFFKQVFYYTQGNDAIAALGEARSRMLLLGAAIGAVIAWWAWRLAGPHAAIIAVVAFCFDPNFLAHSPLLKGDVPITLALLLLTASIWLLGKRATLARCLLVAVMFGAALNVKMSGILAVPILGLALLFRVALPQSWPILGWTARTRARRLLAAAGIAVGSALIAWISIWACYRFRYAPTSDPTASFNFNELVAEARNHQAFAALHAYFLNAAQAYQWQAHWHPSFFLRFALWVNEHRLLPQAWIAGLVITYGNAASFEGYLLGHTTMVGWWYYFPLVMAFKTPLTTLIALALSLGYWAVVRPRAPAWDTFSLALLPMFYLATAMSSAYNVGIRHILPIYPFLFIFLGITFAATLRRRRGVAITVALLFVLGLGAETYSAYPDFIPFFNVAAGGWQNGPHLLGDSNLDWGQDLPAIAEWQSEHPEYQMYLNYFGSADPRYYRIHYVKLPGSAEPDDESPTDSRPHVYVISGNAFQTLWLSPAEKNLYAKLQSQEPMTVLGHCVYVYSPPQGDR
jgi:hypothetical protein